MPKGYASTTSTANSAKGGGPPLQPGVGYEGHFQGEWYGVEVLKVSKDTVQVKWDFDGSDSEVWKDYVRQAANKPKASSPVAVQAVPKASPPVAVQAVSEPAQVAQSTHTSEDKKQSNNDVASIAKNAPVHPGRGYEAFCQGEYHPVEVMKVDKDSITVKWDFDGVVAEIYPNYVRQAAKKVEQPPPAATQPIECAPSATRSTQSADVRKQWNAGASEQKSWGASDRKDSSNSKAPQRSDDSSARKAPLQPGRGYEAFCQGEYHPVEVMKVTKDSVTVKWDFDGVVAEIYPNYVRQAENKDKSTSVADNASKESPPVSQSTHTTDIRKQGNTGSMGTDQKSWSAHERKDTYVSKPVRERNENRSSTPLQPGTGYEAYCQGDYHSVEVLKVTKDSVTVKWAFDGNVDEIYPHYVRQVQVSKAAGGATSKELATSNLWSNYKSDSLKQWVADQKPHTSNSADTIPKTSLKETDQASDISLATVSVRLQKKGGETVPDHCHVKGLPVSITTEQIKQFFSSVGVVKWCKLLPRQNQYKGEDTAAALVQMASPEEARAAVARLNGSDPSECSATASVQSVEEADQILWSVSALDEELRQTVDFRRMESKATVEPSKRIIDAAVAQKVLRWLPKDAPKDVVSYFASLAESPVSSFGGC